MTNNSMKIIRNQVRNGYGVETTPQFVSEVFSAWSPGERARVLNDLDAAAESFEGSTPRETADNMALRLKLEAVDQALRKAGR